MLPLSAPRSTTLIAWRIIDGWPDSASNDQVSKPKAQPTARRRKVAIPAAQHRHIARLIFRYSTAKAEKTSDQAIARKSEKSKEISVASR